ncbi:cytochrome P450 alkane hydroxylase [Coccidioides immitis RS]|uniref:Cytochrome P450 alkane hydroxylase n=1 Tax=Coccidioides immitis (strain RS) TaxID=246410 RepID=A0A0E1RX52_COCIM|nr:cytochrome P450 alkane hydroxylase [Coccidioides immitis RS]EAS33375.2 cytochrome P450 alkane hydroxylase [Coccidioides immitis RS]
MLSALKDIPPGHLALGAAACFLLYQVYLYLTLGLARRKFIQQNGCRPPPAYPHKDPILGLDWALKGMKYSRSRTFLQGTQKRFREHGNTHSLNVIGKPAIATCDPENIKATLATKFQDFDLSTVRKRLFQPLFGKGIFTTDGAEWEHSRAMLRPNFVRSQVADLDMIERHLKNLFKEIPTDGSTVDLQDLFFDLTLDTATEFLFGESAYTLTKKDMGSGERFSDIFTYCTAVIGQWARLGIFLGIPDRRYHRYAAGVHEFADRYVQKALENYRAQQSGMITSDKTSNRYIFLDELVKSTQDPVELRSEALNILLAGRDTTASLLACLWNVLSKRPDVWSKLLNEVDALNKKRPSFEELKNMKFLRYCVNEALRLYPVVPGNTRVAVRDTFVPVGGGPDGKSPVFVPKGTLLNYSVYTMHRREDIYGPDAAEFKPERWEKLRPGWEYLPFNGGPRICLGQQLALTEASYTTVRLMQEFRHVESRDPNPWEELLTVTCASAHGAKVALRP